MWDDTAISVLVGQGSTGIIRSPVPIIVPISQSPKSPARQVSQAVPEGPRVSCPAISHKAVRMLIQIAAMLGMYKGLDGYMDRSPWAGMFATSVSLG